MNALCAICQDLLVPSSDIFVTPCGHVFHCPCLKQWLKSSPSCPQCRQSVPPNKATRIFFNFTTAEDIKEDSVTLQQKVDSLSFQVKLKETEYKNCVSENASIKKQFTGLREEFKKTESELYSKKAVIRAMKEESIFFQNKCKNYDKLEEERDKLKSQITQYENIKSLLCNSEQYVTRMLHGISDVATLTTYVSVMKKELSESLSKRKELRETVRRLQQELQMLKSEKTTCANNYLKQIDELHEALAILRSENDLLHKKISNIKCEATESDGVNKEASELSPGSAGTRKRGIDFDLEHTVIMSKKRKGALEHLKSTDTEKNDDSDVVFVSPVPVRKPKENEENSPYLRTKSKSVLALAHGKQDRGGFSLKQIATSSKKPGLTFKNSQRQDQVIAFDGFGGHSKAENFPISKKSPNKLKRPISDSAKSKKIKLDLFNNKQLDDFVINLT